MLHLTVTAFTLVCCGPVLQVGVISRAAGSAYAEIGQTKLMVAVYGPRPSVRAPADAALRPRLAVQGTWTEPWNAAFGQPSGAAVIGSVPVM